MDPQTSNMTLLDSLSTPLEEMDPDRNCQRMVSCHQKQTVDLWGRRAADNPIRMVVLDTMAGTSSESPEKGERNSLNIPSFMVLLKTKSKTVQNVTLYML